MSHTDQRVEPEAASEPLKARKPRLGWVDSMKGIGIFLVVLGHVLRGLVEGGLMAKGDLVQFLDGWIYSFHMPLFFFASGLFLWDRVRRPTGNFVLTILSTIAYPYFLWSTLQTLLQFAMGRYTNHPVSLEDFWRIAYVPIMQFWFLYALFVILMIYLGLTKARLGRWTILGVFVALKLVVPRMGLIDWPPLLMGASNGIYVALGAAVYHLPWFARLPERLAGARGALVALIGYALVGLMAWSGIAGDDLTKPIRACVGIAATFALASLISSRGIFSEVENWGKLSLQIFVAHSIASAGLRIILVKLMGVTNPLVHVLIGTIGGLYLPIVLTLAAQWLGVEFLFRLRLPKPARRPEAASMTAV